MAVVDDRVERARLGSRRRDDFRSGPASRPRHSYGPETGARPRRGPGGVQNDRVRFGWVRYRSGTASPLFVQFATPCSSIQRYSCWAGWDGAGSAGTSPLGAGGPAGGAVGGQEAAPERSESIPIGRPPSRRPPEDGSTRRRSTPLAGRMGPRTAAAGPGRLARARRPAPGSTPDTGRDRRRTGTRAPSPRKPHRRRRDRSSSRSDGRPEGPQTPAAPQTPERQQTREGEQDSPRRPTSAERPPRTRERRPRRCHARGDPWHQPPTAFKSLRLRRQSVSLPDRLKPGCLIPEPLVAF